MAHCPIPASVGPVQTASKLNQLAVGTSAPCSARKGFPVGRAGKPGTAYVGSFCPTLGQRDIPTASISIWNTSRPERRRHNASDITVVQICRQARITRLGRDIARIYYEVNAVLGVTLGSDF
jgi:hypothetical protein